MPLIALICQGIAKYAKYLLRHCQILLCYCHYIYITVISMKTKQLKYAMIVATIGALSGFIGIVYPDKIFPAFVVTWLLMFPLAALVYLMYGLKEYIKERRNAIVVSIKPNNAMSRFIELTRKEEEIKKEKNTLLKEFNKESKNK